MRLRAFKAQNRTVFGHVRMAGRGILRKAKKLWIKAMPSPAAPGVIISEDFDIPHIFITEETRTPFNPICRRARVRTYRDGCTKSPSSTHDSYSVDSGDEQRPGYEADQPASTFSDDSDDLDTAADDDQYQDLYDILEGSEYEWEPGDTDGPGTENNSPSSNDPEAGDDDDISEPSILEAHCGDGPSFISAPDAGSPWTTSTPTSVFCPPTPVSTLGPSTPSDSESGPSTSLYTPVLMNR
ncbi:hypothetical protein BJV78DRAFT_523605 [Lactifluus subvellereus]|nr:hypothetical protein BJV78DRAFT_523605 [Lactifluus subvellereus]